MMIRWQVDRCDLLIDLDPRVDQTRRGADKSFVLRGAQDWDLCVVFQNVNV